MAISYSNKGAVRNQELSPELYEALTGVATNMGLGLDVFSGGQDTEGPNRVGSRRHDSGDAADMFLTREGERLDWSTPEGQKIFEDFVGQSRGAGITGIGAGDDYMQPGSIHAGYGSEAVWGAGGKGANAPEWLTAAYNGVENPGEAPTGRGIGGSQGKISAGISEAPSKLGAWQEKNRAGLGIKNDQMGNNLFQMGANLALNGGF